MSVWIPNKEWFDQFPSQQDTLDGLSERAQKVAELAAQLTPRSSDERRGHFADRFVVTEVDGQVYVGNTDKSFFHLIEFGANDTPAIAPLRRAIEASGLRFEEVPKT